MRPPEGMTITPVRTEVRGGRRVLVCEVTATPEGARALANLKAAHARRTRQP